MALSEVKYGINEYQYPINATANGDNEIIAANTYVGRIVIRNYTIISDGTVAVKWRSGTTDRTGAMPLLANVPLSPSEGNLVVTNGSSALNLNLSAGSVNVRGHVTIRVQGDCYIGA